MGYIKDEDSRGLLYHLPEEEKALSKALEIAQSPTIKEEFKLKKEQLFRDKVNVTAWMIDTILKEKG